MPTHDELEALLSKRFVSTAELRRFLRGLDQGERLVDELPGEPAAKAEVVHQAALRLVSWGMLPQLHQELAAQFPNHTKDIQPPDTTPARARKPRPRAATPTQPPIRVLHISDLHFSAKLATDRDAVLSGLVRDVATLRQQLGELDLAVLTGDIANTGAKDEYTLAARWLLGPLAEAAGLSARRIRVVPGNHDVNRGAIDFTAEAMEAHLHNKKSQDILESLLDKPEQREPLLRRQSAYAAFARELGLSEPWWSEVLQLQGWRVQLAGFNTAWLSGSDADRGRLLIGRYQAQTLLKGADEADLVIGLMHHPFDYLAEWDPCEEELRRRCGVILHGHLHQQRARLAGDPDRDVLVLAAGSSYSGSAWANAYQVLELDPGAGEARVHFRVWDGFDWIPDRNRYQKAPDAVATLSLRKAAGPPSPPPPPQDTPEARLRQRIADRIGELPAVFELPGQRHAVSDIFVELTLNPESLPRDCDPHARTIHHLQDVLDHPTRRWSLYGEAGCGKTTLLHHLADTLLREPSRLPVPLRVAELQRSDRLHDAVTRAYDAESADLVTAACAAGRAVLLLDGLDEAVHPDDARAAVQSLAADAGNSVLIVSSRDTAYTRPGVGFGELRVLPLTEPQQVELLSRWVGEARAKAELAPMGRRPRLARMAKNPLLLTLMGLVLLRGEGGSLPAQRAELYEDAVGLLLRSAHRPERTRRFDDPPLVREVLSRVALALHGQEQTTWPLTRLREVIEADPRSWPRVKEEWRSVDRFLEAVAQTSDLLVPEGPKGNPRGYRFPHRTFREYLASVALADDLGRNGLGEVPVEVLRRVAKGEPAGVMKLPPGELNRVLEDGVQRPDIWAEVLALTAGALGEGGADRLVRRVAAAGDRRLLLRVVADAEDLQTDTVDAALALERGWDKWEGRAKILEDLPGLVGDAPAVVALIRRFVKSTTDGNDLYFARQALQTIAAGRFPGVEVEKAVREEAEEEAARIFEHLSAEKLAALRALMKPWWREIPAGIFQMGSTVYRDEQPVHRVEFKAPFAMLGVPVTWAMYRLFDEGHSAAMDTFGGKLPKSQQDAVPVYNVTWFSASMFAAWVGGRLPLEAEWEYACRAGSTTQYWSGDTEADLKRVGWYDSNSGGHPHPVAELKANDWGLHDVHGNVWEWCLERYDRDAYKARVSGVTVDYATASYTSASGDAVPASADSAGDGRVLRGGSWIDTAVGARSAYRSRNQPSVLRNVVGFRLVLPAVPPERPSTP